MILAVIQLSDAVFCAIPLRFVTECLDDVELPSRFRSALAPLKAAAAVGLIAGSSVPFLAAVTAACPVAHFLLAVAAHLRAHDLGRNVNATLLTGFSGCVFVTSI